MKKIFSIFAIIIFTLAVANTICWANDQEWISVGKDNQGTYYVNSEQKNTT